MWTHLSGFSQAHDRGNNGGLSLESFQGVVQLCEPATPAEFGRRPREEDLDVVAVRSTWVERAPPTCTLASGIVVLEFGDWLKRLGDAA